MAVPRQHPICEQIPGVNAEFYHRGGKLLLSKKTGAALPLPLLDKILIFADQRLQTELHPFQASFVSSAGSSSGSGGSWAMEQREPSAQRAEAR